MSNFISHVESEIQAAKISGAEKEALLQLADVFDKQGHSGMSAAITLGTLVNAQKRGKETIETDKIDGRSIEDNYTKEILVSANELLDIVNKYDGDKKEIVKKFAIVASYKPLSPLTLDDDEFVEIYEDHYQNKRNPAVFKEGAEGLAYYNHAYVMVNADTGTTWSGSLILSNGKRISKCYIKDTTNMPTIKITVPVEYHNSEDAEDWDFLSLDPNDPQLAELEKYYEVEYVDVW